MNSSSLRLPWAEALAIIGIGFGAWLIHCTFQPAVDTPNYALLLVGALDILLCFGLLGYLLRSKLREGQPLSRGWIVTTAILVAGFLGWVVALFLDADRLLTEQTHHHEYVAQLGKLEDNLRHFSDVVPGVHTYADENAWKDNHNVYAQLHHQLQTSLRSRPAWDKELTRIDERMDEMRKMYQLIMSSNVLEQRMKWRSDFQAARSAALHQAEALRVQIAQAEQDLDLAHRNRWHAVGAAALTGVALVIGCMLFWLLFDRELRRSWKATARLADSEARFRSLVENHADPIAVLDPSANMVYVNPAWQSAFGYEREDLVNRNLLEFIHPHDLPQIQSALHANDPHVAFTCKLKADYGVWHDVEMQCQAQPDAGATVVRFRDVRETPDVPMAPQTDLLPESPEKLKAAEARIAELEHECNALRERESKAQSEARHQRWLLDSHSQANSDGVLVLSASGAVLSWNPAFARMWKLSAETLAAHSWLTIAAHMESQTESGWDDFQRAAHHEPGAAESCWEMTLEGGRTVEAYSQVLAPQAESRAEKTAGAVQFHFRDVTRHKDMETQLRGQHERARDWQTQLDEHEARKTGYEKSLREHEKRLKHLEKQLSEKDRQREELEETLRDHQDRLHQMHRTHEGAAASLKSSKEAMRRLASGVANEFNSVFSVVLGNTDVLRENLPRDHVAQNYLDDIHQAATRGTEIAQRLIAFSRNHLLQLSAIDLNEHLSSLDGKIRAALGHQVQLQWHRGDDELWVKTDPHPLEQALLNVVTHIRQHMPEGGKVTISADRVEMSARDLTHADMHPGKYIRITLRDTGPGIDEERLAHVFEPYHSLREGHKGDLSLATAQGILRQSGGCIDVASEPSKGSEWTILLPETEERPALKASA